MLLEFLVWFCLLLYGTVLERYDGDSLLRVLYKIRLFFQYQRIDFKDSKPSFSYLFSVEDPLVAPVMASVALYWSDSSLAWKDSLNAL